MKSKQLLYVDGLNDGQTHGGNASSTVATPVSSQTGSVETLFSTELKKALTSAPPPSTTSTSVPGADPSTILVIDGIDFLLASDPKIDTVWLQRLLFDSHNKVRSMVVTCSADSPLLHHHGDSATKLEQTHATFTTSLAHTSSLIMQVRALDSGAAKDVTGVLRISKGGGYNLDDQTNMDVNEGEWLYHVKGDGSVRVWSRGE